MVYDGRIMAGFTVPASTTISVTTNAGGPTTVTLTAGTYASVVALCTQLQADLISQRSVSGGTWSVSLSTGASQTLKVTIAVTNGSYSITWTSTNLRDLLGFTADITSQSTSTGASQARGVWGPDCALFMEQHYLDAPRATDLRQTESPTGFVISHVGNVKYRHRSLRYAHVAKAKVHLAAESATNESLERFLIDAQWGLGHTWFTPGSKCVIIAHDGNQVGNGTVAGWYLKGCASLDTVARRVGDAWDGVWTCEFPELISNS